MEKKESIFISIGYKIKIEEILEKLNENTFELCKLFFKYGRIEDEKSSLNNTYFFLIQNNKSTDYESYKQYMIKHFTNKNNLNQSLSDNFLLIPIYEILQMNRKDYQIFGINTKSINLEEMKKLLYPKINENIMKFFEYELVMITELAIS